MPCPDDKVNRLFKVDRPNKPSWDREPIALAYLNHQIGLGCRRQRLIRSVLCIIGHHDNLRKFRRANKQPGLVAIPPIIKL